MGFWFYERTYTLGQRHQHIGKHGSGQGCSSCFSNGSIPLCKSGLACSRNGTFGNHHNGASSLMIVDLFRIRAVKKRCPRQMPLSVFFDDRHPRRTWNKFDQKAGQLDDSTLLLAMKVL